MLERTWNKWNITDCQQECKRVQILWKTKIHQPEVFLNMDSTSLTNIGLPRFLVSSCASTGIRTFKGLSMPSKLYCTICYNKIFSFYLFLYFFIYLWLRWVFVAACGLSLVAVSGGYSSLRCMGFSLWWLLLLEHGLQEHGLQQLQHVGSVVAAHGLQSAGSVVAHGLRGSKECGIFPDQGSNPCPLHWQADS